MNLVALSAGAASAAISDVVTRRLARGTNTTAASAGLVAAALVYPAARAGPAAPADAWSRLAGRRTPDLTRFTIEARLR